VEPERKADFRSYLKQNGIASGEHYPIPIPDQEALNGVEHEAASDLAVATRIARSEVSLPIHPYLSDEEVTRVIEVSNAFGAA
jgi:dTDP-4-amino-4,6-dideoxygalactose transaminase